MPHFGPNPVSFHQARTLRSGAAAAAQSALCYLIGLSSQGGGGGRRRADAAGMSSLSQSVPPDVRINANQPDSTEESNLFDAQHPATPEVFPDCAGDVTLP